MSTPVVIGEGGPAFPVFSGGSMHGTIPGMTVLDYFAAAALPVAAMVIDDTPRPIDRTIGQHIALIAYSIAMRMVEERKRKAHPSS
jgi:hypothetical protein